jgi:hypothetical protein
MRIQQQTLATKLPSNSLLIKEFLMAATTCSGVQILLKSEVLSAPMSSGHSPELTDVVGFQGFSPLGEMPMPPIKLSVELSFQQGQKTVYSVETPGTAPAPQADAAAAHPPYRLADATGPECPTMISSTSFVQVR